MGTVMQTFVIGHKNPDMDSICSALAYARLKQLTGMKHVTAARCGHTNERIDFVLNKFGVEAPVFVADVSPTVADVMERDVITIKADSAVYDAMPFLEQKRLPVVNEENHCLGLLSAFKISRYLFPRRSDIGSARWMQGSIRSIAETFDGHIVGGNVSDESRDLMLMVAAMSLETFAERIRNYAPESVVLIVGNREEVQDLAVASKVCAVVVTGGHPVSPTLRANAAAAGVTIIASHYDTATTVLLARGAVKVDQMLDTDFESFAPDTPLHIARDVAMHSPSFLFPVMNDKGELLGMFSKSDFIKGAQRQLILVDHNEMSQAVNGADRVPIIEVLDHHRLGGFATDHPILFWNNPVGSTSTIVALCYQSAGIEIPKDMAGLLMAGLISDTLNLTSPTSTSTDKAILAQLAKITGVEPADLANQIFSVGSPLLTMTPEQAINADCKEYEEAGERFSVAQIEELTFAHFAEKEQALREALVAQCAAQKLFFAALLVTDINTQTSVLIVAGAPEFLAQIDFPVHGPNAWELAGVVSRKKQLLPYLLNCLTHAKAKPVA
jgi:manganese-dependent inorganic pyrophosphatase